MPRVSRFHGIVIYMYYREHEAAHFHAYRGEFKMTVRFSDGACDGRFPPAERRRVLSWYRRHRHALWQNWLRMRAGRNPLSIPPWERPDR